MKDVLISIVIIACTLLVCGAYFKYVIRAWLSRDAELRALVDVGAAPVIAGHDAPHH